MLHLVLPHSDHASRLRLLASSAFPGFGILPHNSLQDALFQNPPELIIIPLETPMEALAQRLAAGQAYDTALQDWMEETATGLSAYRKARRRIQLLARTPFLVGDPESWAALAARQGVTTRPFDADMPPPPKNNGIDALYYLLAGHLLQTHPRAQALAAEVEAMISGPCPSLENSPWLVQTALQDVRAQHAQVDTLLTERDLLHNNLSEILVQLSTTQAEQARLAKTRQELENTLNAQSSMLKTSQKTTTQVRKSIHDINKERDLLRENMSGLLEQLSTAQAKLATLVDTR
ncbi:hypothetical protein SAMN04488092_1211, partial [Thalassovita taeanensis]